MSPIERLFLKALLEAAPAMGTAIAVFPPGLTPGESIKGVEFELIKSGGSKGTALLFPQAKVEQYIVDFAIVLGHKGGLLASTLAVECDGHEWHERTPQQAAYDRARDRRLLAHRALPTIRFTGMAINRDANQCAIECVEVLHSLIGHAYEMTEQAIEIIVEQKNDPASREDVNV